MDMEELKMLLETVLFQLNRKTYRILVVSFGSNQQEREIYTFLKQYQDNCHYQFVFSAAYEEIFDSKKWCELGEVLINFDAQTQEELCEIDLILVPFLTRNSLAKLSLGIADNLPLTLINQGILMGKRIFASNHCWRMDTDFAGFRGMDKNIPLQNLYGEYESAIKELGIHSLPLKEWKETVEIFFDSNGEAVSHLTKKKSVAKHVLTLKDVKQNPINYLNDTNRMTDLAKEFLNEYRKKGDVAGGI